nr:gamma-glutamyl-phosphate reductase [Endozoicomonas sp.]
MADQVTEYMHGLGQRARQASQEMAVADTEIKNRALLAIADALEADRAQLKFVNTRDLEAGRERGLDAAMLDR